jgi:putative membrane protein
MERTRNRNLWIGLGVLALFVLLALPLMGGERGLVEPGYGFRPFGFGGPLFWGFWGIGLLFRLVIWSGLLFLIVNLFRRRSFARHDDPSALEILRQRYAAGEISREQYDEMRNVLEPTPST